MKWRKNNHHGNRPRTAETSYNNADKFKTTYGSCSNYHSGKVCGHMSMIYYLYDGHGSVEHVHGKGGSTFRLEFDTYGNLVAGIVEKWHVWYNDIFAHRTVSIYAYSGERYNCVSELQYLRARWYDTELGRFISEDSYLGTQENPLSRNRYIYTHNNPVNYVDPSGHIVLSTLIAGAVIAGIGVGIISGVVSDDWRVGVVAGATTAVGIVTAGAAAGYLAAGAGMAALGGTALTFGQSMAVGGLSAAASSVTEMTLSHDLGLATYTPASAVTKLAIDTSWGILTAGIEYKVDELFNTIAYGGQYLDESLEMASKKSNITACDVDESGSGIKTYMNGVAGELELANMYGGTSQAYLKTSQGGRYIDQLADGIAHESKVGYTTLTDRIRTQVLKDVELINTGQIDGAHWHFFTSGVTNRGGASQPLLDFLTENGISYTIH